MWSGWLELSTHGSLHHLFNSQESPKYWLLPSPWGLWAGVQRLRGCFVNSRGKDLLVPGAWGRRLWAEELQSDHSNLTLSFHFKEGLSVSLPPSLQPPPTPPSLLHSFISCFCVSKVICPGTNNLTNASVWSPNKIKLLSFSPAHPNPKLQM